MAGFKSQNGGSDWKNGFDFLEKIKLIALGRKIDLNVIKKQGLNTRFEKLLFLNDSRRTFF